MSDRKPANEGGIDMDRDSYRAKPDAWQTGSANPEQDRPDDRHRSGDARPSADVFNADAVLSALSRDDADEAPDGADEAAEPDLEAALRATFASFGEETYEDDDPKDGTHGDADEVHADHRPDDPHEAVEPDLETALRAAFLPVGEETYEDDRAQDETHEDDAFEASPAAEGDAEDPEVEDPATNLSGDPLPAPVVEAIASAPALEDDEAPGDDVPLFDDEAVAVEEPPQGSDPFAAEETVPDDDGFEDDDAEAAVIGPEGPDAETGDLATEEYQHGSDDVTASGEPEADSAAPISDGVASIEDREFHVEDTPVPDAVDDAHTAAQLFADDRADAAPEPEPPEARADDTGGDSVAAFFTASEDTEDAADGGREPEAVFAAPSAGDAGLQDETVFASLDDPDMPGRKPRIALMGEFSAGKSTLSNLLIGSNPLPTRVTATQLPPVWISWGDGQAYREDLDGTTHPIDIERIGDIDPAETRVVRLFCRSDILELCDIIDMPGISDPNMSSDVWERLIGKADGVIWCTHATQAWRQSEAAVWESLDHAIFSKSLLLITRFDKLRNEIDRARVMKRVERETRDLFSARLPISLTQALSAGDDAETWRQSGAADFTDRLVSILHELATSLGSETGDRLGGPLDDETADADARPRSARVHRGAPAAPVMPRRVVPRRVRPVTERGRRDAAF